MAYGYLETDGKYVVTYKIFIVTSHSIKEKKRTVRHESSPSRKSVLVQKILLDQKLKAVVSINLIKLFCV